MGLTDEDKGGPHVSDYTVQAFFFNYKVNMFIYMVNGKGSSVMTVLIIKYHHI